MEDGRPRSFGLPGDGRQTGAGQADAVPGDRPGRADESNLVPQIVIAQSSHVYFIRSSEIIGTGEIAEAEIKRLQGAVGRVSDVLRPRPVVMNADVISTSEVPVLLFARPDLDLTGQVKVVYEAMKREAEDSPVTTDAAQEVAKSGLPDPGAAANDEN